jgi:hypothetical protein
MISAAFLRLVCGLGCAAVAVIGAAVLPAVAADMPAEVAHAVEEAQQYCRNEGGTPRQDAGFSRVLDLNGDGREDWILNFSKFHCVGSIPPEPYCGSGGCGLMVFVWQEGSAWKQVFDGVVQRFRLFKAKSGFRLDVSVAGNMCGRIDAHSCREVYEFRGSDLVRVDERATPSTR